MAANRDCMVDLTLIARQARWNSERWFPDLHARDAETIRLHYVLGMAGETGEVADLFKKIHTGKRDFETEHDNIASELADVFTYLLLLADDCKIDLPEAFEAKQRVCEERWG